MWNGLGLGLCVVVCVALLVLGVIEKRGGVLSALLQLLEGLKATPS